MSKGRFTEADIHRIFHAAVKAGVTVKLELRPDGTIVATTGKPGEANGNGEANEWDEVIPNGQPATPVR
jgi:hypothetical protein